MKTTSRPQQSAGRMGQWQHYDIQAAFAASFSNWRRESKLTLKKIAMDLGISVSTVNSWELGQRFPSGRHLGMLIEYSGQPPCWFFCAMQDYPASPELCSSLPVENPPMARRRPAPIPL